MKSGDIIFDLVMNKFKAIQNCLAHYFEVQRANNNIDCGLPSTLFAVT